MANSNTKRCSAALASGMERITLRGRGPGGQVMGTVLLQTRGSSPKDPGPHETQRLCCTRLPRCSQACFPLTCSWFIFTFPWFGRGWELSPNPPPASYQLCRRQRCPVWGPPSPGASHPQDFLMFSVEVHKNDSDWAQNEPVLPLGAPGLHPRHSLRFLVDYQPINIFHSGPPKSFQCS